MYVHFIDTSVFTNIINVPGRNQQHDSVMKELKDLLGQKDKNALILPYATIIETGNHIAHCGDGNQRRKAAEKFTECIEKTIHNKAPWQYYGNQLTPEDLEQICGQFPDFAMRGEGFGDLSIIRAYQKYKEETPAVHKIRIWSVDTHLKGIYEETIEPVNIRNRG